MDNWYCDKCKEVHMEGQTCGAIKPPLGLIPKRFHDERVKVERFNEVCGAIVRHYDAGLKINVEWIEEYNELVECIGKHCR